jgi:RNA polymerase-binding transcription factor DksA
MADARQRVLDDLAENGARIAGLEAEHARIVEASESSNADDEHDPEGPTIAFERQQVATLLEQARRTRADLQHALVRLEDGSYGVCERCGGPIAPERLEARPNARTCIACASGRTPAR